MSKQLSMVAHSNTLQCTELKLPVPWGHIAAKTWGHTTDKRVLVVHGIQDNAGSFDRLIKLLPETFYYVCIDLPGHGLSSHFPAGLPLEYFTYVNVIHFVLQALEWERCIYIGHSFGAMLGITFSVLCPKRIERLICIDGVIANPLSDEEVLPYLKEMHDIAIKSYSYGKPYLYSKEEVLHTLMCKRFSALNLEAAKAVFTRAVTKVGDMYKYNRDPRTKLSIKPLFSINQHVEVLRQINIPIRIIVAHNGLPLAQLHSVLKTSNLLKQLIKNEEIFVNEVEGNHDVHNNNPERVAPYVAESLIHSIESKL